MTNDENGATATPVMFLAVEDWSRRFDNTFFTMKMESFELITAMPESDSSLAQIIGKHSFPAYYYKLDVFSGYEKRSLLRRYSQFAVLYTKLIPRDSSSDLPVLPPGTCIWQPQNDNFAQNRLEQLQEFLRDLLQRPGVSSDPAMVAFLELSNFVHQ